MAIVNAVLGEPSDVEEGGETGAWGELPTRTQHTHATAVRRATGSEDAFQSYLQDIRERDLRMLTPDEEIELAQRAVAGNTLALHKLVEQPVSLDTPVDDETHYSLADSLEDTATSAPAETASQHLLGEELHRALDLLTPRERAVITRRYGVGDGQSRTLLEIGKELGISRERVRQIEAAALKKMRCFYGSQ